MKRIQAYFKRDASHKMASFKANFKRDESHASPASYTSHPKSLPLALTLTLAFAFCSLHAADMQGAYNTWLGYISGINADGDNIGQVG